ncbi:cell wall metabolism sensor histidine kinase WalK [Geothrix sp. PMB-07]|uniref:sensor histidine kinase n=1 Tax=Geothrix sp. PMB-07 TaxID=3068640 RepID=UPI002740BB0F|nr:HAMP domain-containing sensor histidine kinase [Geothrix sp. PMB-07]WLT33400.1 HAMP domain-containing sensor histidine kinase [Geothrix sp. PMB-07]
MPVFLGRAIICLISMLFLGFGLGMSVHQGVSLLWAAGLLGTLALVLVLMARWQVRAVAQPLDSLERDTPPKALQELPRAWLALQRENIELKEKVGREDRLLPGIMARLEEGVLLFGARGDLEQFNPAAQRHLGLGAPLAKGMAVGDVLRGQEGLDLVQKAYGGVPGEWRLARAGRTLRVRAIPFAPHGSVSGVLLTLDDVTSQEALETTRQKFISNVSHELKTPVTAIRIAAENLQEENLDEASRSSAQSIMRSVDRLTLLLGDLSELSRIESGALHLAPVQLDLAAFLDGLMKDLQPRGEALGVVLALEVDAPQGATILADPLRLHQVIENLVSNALKFSPAQGRVNLRVRVTTHGQIWEVQDQGPGIPEAEQGRIFERFYRAKASMAKPGTGLGLAIVKHLCRLMGGEVSVFSVPGEGATFKVILPPQIETQERPQ